MGRWEALDEVVIQTLTADEARRHLDDLMALRESLEARLTATAAALTGLESTPVSESVRAGGRISHREARRIEDRAQLVALEPRLGSAPTAVVDAAASAAKRLETDAERKRFARAAVDVADGARVPETAARSFRRLADQARSDDARTLLERQRARVTASRGIDDETGMWWLRAEFDPETGARVFAAWDAHTRSVAARSDGRHGPHAEGLALGEMLLNGGQGGPTGVELIVLVDLAILAGADDGICETVDGEPLDPEVVRRLACLADRTLVVLDEHGLPLHVGRDARHATPGQRAALRALYDGCGWPGCDGRWSACEIHHLHYWEDGGRTDLDNLLPLCRRHHHHVHDRGLRLELAADRTLTVTDRSGRTIDRAPPPRLERAA